MKQLIIIAAAGENNALGKDNDLPWHLPDDFKRFKALTSGHKIIMGRKTLESFPKALPNREHIAITRDTSYQPKFPCQIVHSLENALALIGPEETAFIIGGGEIYRQALDFATDIELTRVHASFEADTFFPEIDEQAWELVREDFHPADERHKHSFTYLTYKRK
ncbi:dihydrofolate reductase [Flagellimonas flava]|uniref:Dihydrofolate reductase n=1 Tax=Flagellimonas flava TaxID=570519 RepID=A0A1M5MZ79_9FLAO|nr:dihydrofolate reductase [Allomuricauda flava]SHG82656.1 dihydrofolate reductase [Allomuricauda flava]